MFRKHLTNPLKWPINPNFSYIAITAKGIFGLRQYKILTNYICNTTYNSYTLLVNRTVKGSLLPTIEKWFFKNVLAILKIYWKI